MRIWRHLEINDKMGRSASDIKWIMGCASPAEETLLANVSIGCELYRNLIQAINQSK